MICRPARRRRTAADRPAAPTTTSRKASSVGRGSVDSINGGVRRVAGEPAGQPGRVVSSGPDCAIPWCAWFRRPGRSTRSSGLYLLHDGVRRRRPNARRPGRSCAHRRLRAPRARADRHPRRPPARKVHHETTRSSIDTQKGRADWFTGDVYIDAVAAPAASSIFAAASVDFTPGARTAWHTHPHGQTIFVTEGVGRRQREGGRIQETAPATESSSNRARTTGTARPGSFHGAYRHAAGRRERLPRHLGRAREAMSNTWLGEPAHFNGSSRGKGAAFGPRGGNIASGLRVARPGSLAALRRVTGDSHFVGRHAGRRPPADLAETNTRWEGVRNKRRSAGCRKTRRVRLSLDFGVMAVVGGWSVRLVWQSGLLSRAFTADSAAGVCVRRPGAMVTYGAAVRWRGGSDARVRVCCSAISCFLVPVSMRDWVDEGHLAWFVIDVVGELDTGALHRRPGGAPGRPPYEPEMMCAVLLYAYCCGMRSSRRIEDACRTDAAFRVICGGLVPDHATIARFVVDHERALEGLVCVGVAAVRGGGAGGSVGGGAGRHQDGGRRGARSQPRRRPGSAARWPSCWRRRATPSRAAAGRAGGPGRDRRRRAEPARAGGWGGCRPRWP